MRPELEYEVEKQPIIVELSVPGRCAVIVERSENGIGPKAQIFVEQAGVEFGFVARTPGHPA